MKANKTPVRSAAMQGVVCVLLCAAVLLVYHPVAGHDFINYDDDLYVTGNRMVQNGFSLDGLLWAFTLKHEDGSYWQPLTWISHMLDCQLFGLDPGKHHLHSLAIHLLNSVVLFLLFRRMTGELWPSAFMAAMFAVHPVNVDSVAWISERKSVLSTFFFLASMAAYVHYAAKPSTIRYLVVMLAFTLGVLAKPLLVSLPMVLLLMDYWPLDRFRHPAADGREPKVMRAVRLFVEKVPLFLLTLFFTRMATSSLGGNLISFDQVPLATRLLNIPIFYVRYAVKTAVPANLSIHYPYPAQVSAWQSLAALLVVVTAIGLAIRFANTHRFGIVFLLWFLGTLVPVLGIVQAGLWPATADRWLYIPAIGLFGIVSWSAGELLKTYGQARVCIRAAAGAILVALTAVSWVQVGHWVDSERIFKHAVAVTSDNLMAHNNLGNALTVKGRLDEAAVHYTEALRIKPDYANAHNNLGMVCYMEGDFDRAIVHFRRSLALDGNNAKAHNNLGAALSAKGLNAEALMSYQRALRADPQYAEAYNNIGFLLYESGRIEESVTLFEQAIKHKPAYRKARENLQMAVRVLQTQSN